MAPPSTKLTLRKRLANVVPAPDNYRSFFVKATIDNLEDFYLGFGTYDPDEEMELYDAMVQRLEELEEDLYEFLERVIPRVEVGWEEQNLANLIHQESEAMSPELLAAIRGKMSRVLKADPDQRRRGVLEEILKETTSAAPI